MLDLLAIRQLICSNAFMIRPNEGTGLFKIQFMSDGDVGRGRCKPRTNTDNGLCPRSTIAQHTTVNQCGIWTCILWWQDLVISSAVWIIVNRNSCYFFHSPPQGLRRVQTLWPGQLGITQSGQTSPSLSLERRRPSDRPSPPILLSRSLGRRDSWEGTDLQPEPEPGSVDVFPPGPDRVPQQRPSPLPKLRLLFICWFSRNVSKLWFQRTNVQTENNVCVVQVINSWQMCLCSRSVTFAKQINHHLKFFPPVALKFQLCKMWRFKRIKKSDQWAGS